MAKISPDYLAEVRVRPELLHGLFFEVEESADEAPAGFDPDTDVLGTDYRTLNAVAEGMAEGAGLPADFEEQDTWLSKAAHGTGDVLDYEFCYGPAWVLEPEVVTRIAAGLAEEGWDNEEYFDDDENLGKFFAAAAREGKAIVGGVN